MASLDLNMGGKQTTEEKTQYPLRLIMLQVNNSKKQFKVDLKRLQQHSANIVKFKNESNMEELQSEHMKATLTIKKLRSNVQHLEQIRAKVQEHERDEFSQKVDSIRSEVQRDVQEFLAVHGAEKPVDNGPGPVTEASANGTRELRIRMLEQTSDQASPPESPQEIQKQLQLDPVDPNAEKTVKQLEEGQQKTVDDIEDNVTSAEENVAEGTSYLAQAAKLKTVALPVLGAALGGILGGPVGLAAGAKLGFMAGLGGGALGFTGGQIMKNRMQTDVDETELARLDQQAAENAPAPEQDPDPAPDPYNDSPHL